MKRNKSFCSILMAGVILVSGALTSCNMNGSKEEKETISILAKNSWYTTIDYEQCPIIQQVEEDSGYSINWNLRQPSSYYDAVRPLLMSDSSGLSDIIQLTDLDTNMEYIKAETFTALDEYMELMPNFRSFLDENPEIEASLTTEDGHIYYVPQTVLTVNYQPCLMYNQTWLEKAGISQPSNLEEFVNMLRIYSENDMNGNGDTGDEVPMSVMADFLPYMFGPAFGLDLVSGFYGDDDNVVHYSYCDEVNYKKFLNFLSGLYNEGLLEKSYETLTRQDITKRCAQDETGVIFDYSWQLSSLYDAQYPDYNGSNPVFKAGKPLSGEYDGYYIGRNAISGLFGVNAASGNIQNAVKLLDILMGENMQTLYSWGMDYEVDDEGNKYYTKDTQDDTYLQNQGINPICVPSQQSVAATDEFVPFWHRKQDKMLAQFVKAPFPFIYATEMEAEIINGYENYIANYVNQERNNFIAGRKDLNTFEDYIKVLYDMNIEKIIQVKQQQYERYLKIKSK
ncbi:MAG: extracellular solute-binding protein [Eubacteriales bacterium]|nr:extracellular solute-binding protein [Eubacteriales bacterium]